MVPTGGMILRSRISIQSNGLNAVGSSTRGQGASLAPQPTSCQALRVLLTHPPNLRLPICKRGMLLTMETQEVQTEAPPGTREGVGERQLGFAHCCPQVCSHVA